MRKSYVDAYRFVEKRVGKTFTANEINAALKVGDYASRAVWGLKNKLGVEITTNKDGRTVVDYLVVSIPEVTPVEVTSTEAKLTGRKATKVAKKATAKKVEKAKKAATKKSAKPAAKKTATVAKTNRDSKGRFASKVAKTVEADVTSNEVAAAIDVPEFVAPDFSVDADFDAIEAENIADLLG